MANILYQKLERQYSDDGGNTWISMNVYKVGDIIENPSDCKADLSTCRWRLLDASLGYTCDGVNKYQVEIEECTNNGGLLWTPTGNRRPSNVLIESNSCDCGYREYRWVVVEGEYICGEDSFTKYEKEVYSEGCGDNWVIAEPYQERKGDILECFSLDCGATSNEIIFETDGTNAVLRLEANEGYCEYNVNKILKEKNNTININDNFNDEYKCACNNDKLPCDLWRLRIEHSNATVDCIGYSEKAKITNIIKFIDTTYFTSFRFSFSNLNEMIEFNTEHIKTDNVLDMGWMFNDCKSLKTLDVSTWNTSNVKTMHWMFDNCNSLNNLNGIGNFNVSNVSDFRHMFQNCYSLTELDLSKWRLNNLNKPYETPHVAVDIQTTSGGTIEYMFSGCINLRTLNLSNWGLSGVIETNGLFDSCCRLSTLDLSGWNDVKFNYNRNLCTHDVVTDDFYCDNMFYRCLNLETVYLNDCSNETINYIISHIPLGNKNRKIETNTPICDDYSKYNLIVIGDKGRFAVNSDLENQDGFVRNSVGATTILEYIKLPDTSNWDNFNDFFEGSCCDIDTSIINTSKGKYFYGMFSNVSSNNINFDSLDLTNAETLKAMFYNSELKHIDLSNVIKPINKINVNSLFSSCERLLDVNFNNWDGVKLTDCAEMFYRCEMLTTLDLSMFDMSNANRVNGMFKFCYNLITLDLSGWVLNDSIEKNLINYSHDMFDYCYSLKQVIMIGCDEFTIKLISRELPNNVEIITNKDDIKNYQQTMSSTTLSFEYPYLSCPLEYNLNNTKYVAIEQNYETQFNDILLDCSSAFTDTNIKVLNSFPDTSNVTNMTNMFSYCTELTELDLSNWNVSKVRDMTNMFAYCNNLTELDLSNWDTSNVTSMTFMFNDCKSLTHVNMSNIIFGEAEVYRMFSGCSNLDVLDLSGSDLRNIISPIYMFYGSTPNTIIMNDCDCKSIEIMQMVLTYEGVKDTINFITNIDCNNHDNDVIFTYSGESVTFYPNYANTAMSSSYFEEIANSGNSTDNGDGTYTYTYYTKLDYVYSSCYRMFGGCKNIINFIHLPNTSNVSNMSYMFNACRSLTSLDLSSFNTSACTNMNGMFSGCSGLTELDLSGWDMTNVTNYDDMFNNCISLTSITMNNCNCETIDKIKREIYDLEKVSIITNTECINTSNILSFEWSGSSTGHSYYINEEDNWADTNPYTVDLTEKGYTNITSLKSMFGYDFNTVISITSLPDTSNVTNMEYMFYSCKITSLDVTKTMNTSNVTNMRYMFAYCNNLTELDLSNWDVSKVDTMHNMFNCSKLTTLNLSNWDLASITEYSDVNGYWFNTPKLTTVYMNNCDEHTIKIITDALNDKGYKTTISNGVITVTH